MEGEVAAGQGKGEGDSKTGKDGGGWSTIKGDVVGEQEWGDSWKSRERRDRWLQDRKVGKVA